MSKETNLFPELYGKRVQMNDRLESEHIWSEELALLNAGRWTPKCLKCEHKRTKYCYKTGGSKCLDCGAI